MSIWIALAAALTSLVLTLLAMPLVIRLSHRFGMLDLPGKHKTHGRAMPLLGGSAILAGVLLPSMLVLAVARVWSAGRAPTWLPLEIAMHVEGAASRAWMGIIILAGAVALHVLGLIDDKKDLAWPIKFAGQAVVCLVVILLAEVRVLTVAGGFLSVVVTLLWLLAITNAFNFLDNMDGLSAGVGAIVCCALMGAAVGMGQVFVMGWSALLLGALTGFLVVNFPPAKVFMGDAGSQVVGYMLAVLSCLTTYVRPGQTYYLYGVFVPVLLMAVPIYDMVSVVWLRLRAKANPFVGDQRHFSHRLRRRGMTMRTAVLTIYLCTAGTAIAASLLAHIRDNAGAVLVAGQTLLFLLVIAVLEQPDTKP